MTLPPSHLTNAATNLLHALFLLAYVIGAYVHWKKGSPNVRIGVVAFFALTFLLKVGGAYVHFVHKEPPLADDVIAVWIGIGFGIVALNTQISFLLPMPRWTRALIVALSASLCALFIVEAYRIDFYRINFIYVAVSLILTYLIAAICSSGLLRLGWILVILSNLAWIAMNELLDLKGYQHDLYHFALIASTFIVYKSATKGLWNYPKTEV